MAVGLPKFPTGQHCAYHGNPDLAELVLCMWHPSNVPLLTLLEGEEYVENLFLGEPWASGVCPLQSTKENWLNGIAPVWLAHPFPEMGVTTWENGYIPNDKSTIQQA